MGLRRRPFAFTQEGMRPPIPRHRLSELRLAHWPARAYKAAFGAENGLMADNHVAMELVVAAAENDVIGRDNGLPWRLPADLRHFKALTIGKTVLMGRKTYESIGKALPQRKNLVLSRSADFAPGDCTKVASLEEACRAATGVAGAGLPAELMVIGGAKVFELCLPLARRIYLTLVHTRIDGDAFFSGWRGAEWRESSREFHAADAKNSNDFSFITLERAGG
jgi:dihydrofolate reductase